MEKFKQFFNLYFIFCVLYKIKIHYIIMTAKSTHMVFVHPLLRLLNIIKISVNFKMIVFNRFLQMLISSHSIIS